MLLFGGCYIRTMGKPWYIKAKKVQGGVEVEVTTDHVDQSGAKRKLTLIYDVSGGHPPADTRDPNLYEPGEAPEVELLDAHFDDEIDESVDVKSLLSQKELEELEERAADNYIDIMVEEGGWH